MARSSTSFKPGARPGPGRPKGSVTLATLIQSRLRRKDEVIDFFLSRMRSDGRDAMEAAKWLGDHLYGRPPQRVEHAGEGGGPIPVTVYVPDNGR